MSNGILSRIGNALTSPTATGLLGAAATGFNPLLGLLAVPALRNDRERAQLANEAARENIRNSQAQRQQRESQQSALQQFIRSGLSADPLASAIAPETQEINQAERLQAQQMGLLAQANPEGVATAMTAQAFPQAERSAPADIRMMQALGLPLTPEGFAQFKSMGQTADPAQQLEFMRLQLEFNALMEKRQREAGQEAEDSNLASFEIGESIRTAGRILEATDVLEGTFLEPGSVGLGTRSGILGVVGEVAGLAGKKQTQADFKRQRDALATIQKDAPRFVISMLNSSGLEATNSQLEFLKAANANENIPPAVIRSVMTETVNSVIEESRIKNIQIPEADLRAWEKILEKFSPQQSPDLGGTITELDQLTPAERAELMSLLQQVQNGG